MSDAADLLLSIAIPLIGIHVHANEEFVCFTDPTPYSMIQGVQSAPLYRCEKQNGSQQHDQSSGSKEPVPNPAGLPN